MAALAEHIVGPVRGIAHRTPGRGNGPAVRLMSPSDLGQILKPFVFLDFFDMQGPPFTGALHPHSGIATLSYLIEGRMDLIDPSGDTVVLPAGGVEWMQAGRGMWHGGSVGDARQGRVRGFQLWIALPPELELGPTHAVFQSVEDIAHSGPARVLLGSHGDARSAIEAPSPMNVLAVTLAAGQRWTYTPPPGHTVLWVSPAEGDVLANGHRLHARELTAFESSDDAVEFRAIEHTQFMLGSAVPHDHDLAIGYYSVHTSPTALLDGEAYIRALGRQLAAEGRLPASVAQGN
ncbi:pirin family protein [Bordetella genomosp. 13]|uniref:pirin family protein n=1 Tax=Bordetella genomosp. 13 TaxID=463040 RepID=UPI0011A251E3|nr:pirin family protein [Bordetella genomosp. 13]